MTGIFPAPAAILSVARRLPGPVFDKELRVASRQRRSYILRFAYVGLLTIFVAGAWLSLALVGSSRSAAYQASRMGIAGRYIAVTIVWFQFVAAQVLAVVLLTKAIDREIRQRTLRVLAVTPLSGLQIVGGKLAAGLLPTVMLLATSLPLLAIVRVLGGVSWDYVLSGVCIAFTATVFIGTLSLIPSAPYGNVFLAILPVAWYMVLCRGMDSLIEWLGHFLPRVGEIGMSVMRLINSTDVLLARTQEALAARSGTGLSAWWPIHCLILLGGSLTVALWMARRVRTISAAASPHDRDEASRRRGTWADAGRIRTKASRERHALCARPIQRVQGSPIVWKELCRFPMWRSGHPLAWCGEAATVAFLLAVFLIAYAALLEGPDRMAKIPALLALLGFALPGGPILGLAPMAAGAIAEEREAQTLPILLMIPWEDSAIVKDKARAVLRCLLSLLLPCSVPFVFLLMLSSELPTQFNLAAVLYGAGLYLASLPGVVSFLIGLGLYCSARLKTTGGATVCMFGISFGLILGGYAALAPIARRYVRGQPHLWLIIFIFTVLASLALTVAGLALLRMASHRLRRNVF